jgi:quinol monooxygenase YgiN
MSAVTVVATITAQPGAEAQLTKLFQEMVPPTRQEAGCLRYDLHRDPKSPATLVFLETWESQTALQAHMETPRFLAARTLQEGLVAARNIQLLEKL